MSQVRSVWTRNFPFIKRNPEQAQLELERFELCKFTIPVFADLTDFSNELKNDYSSWIAFFNPLINNAQSFLVKCGQEIPISNTGLGAWLTVDGRKPFAAFVNWNEILAEYGTGCYQIKLIGLGAGFEQVFFSFKYELNHFSYFLADQTVRLEWFNNNQIGDLLDNEDVRDFNQSNFRQQIRLPFAKFGSDKTDAVNESVRYQNGFNEFTQIEKEQSYILRLTKADSLLHKFLQFDVFMNNFVEIIDYNSNNAMPHLKTKVNQFGAYEPDYSDPNNLTPSVEVECKAAFKNHIKFRN